MILNNEGKIMNVFNELYKIQILEGDGNWTQDRYLSTEELYQIFKERLINELEVKSMVKSSSVNGMYVESKIIND